jgi:hypothetical protein
LELSRVCRDAARERFISASDFVRGLSTQQLCAFWYFGSAKCCTLIHSIGHILEHSAWQEEEKAFYSRKLKEFKWTLKLSGEAGAFFMIQALALLNRPMRLTTESKDADGTHRSPITRNLSSQSGFDKDLSLMETWSPDQASMSNGTENNFSDISADVDFLTSFPLDINPVYAPTMVQGVYVNVYQQHPQQVSHQNRTQPSQHPHINMYPQHPPYHHHLHRQQQEQQEQHQQQQQNFAMDQPRSSPAHAHQSQQFRPR